MRAGGTIKRTLVLDRGTQYERRAQYLLPALAVCRASAAFVYTLGINRAGVVEFIDSLGRPHNYRKGVIKIEMGMQLPAGYQAGTSLVGGWSNQAAWSEMVPVVPPKHRPARASTLDSCLVLWEAQNWTWRSVPAPPGDPALLRHVGGDIYAVIATWDLTDLERLVLAGRRPE